MNAGARCRRAAHEVAAYVRRLLPHGRAATAPQPAGPPPVRLPVARPSPWRTPWTTPTPAHVRERYAPLRGEDVALVRPYVIAEERRQREEVRAELAEAGKDRRLYVLV